MEEVPFTITGTAALAAGDTLILSVADGTSITYRVEDVRPGARPGAYTYTLRARREPEPQPEPPRWDVYRDEDGKPVTISEEQLRAIWHAINTVDSVRAAEGVARMGDHGNWKADAYKSRLLGRMLLNGRPPLNDKPPTMVLGARDYGPVDPDWLGDYREK